MDEKKPPAVGVPTPKADRWLNVLNEGVPYDVDFFLRVSASYVLFVSCVGTVEYAPFRRCRAPPESVGL